MHLSAKKKTVKVIFLESFLDSFCTHFVFTFFNQKQNDVLRCKFLLLTNILKTKHQQESTQDGEIRQKT